MSLDGALLQGMSHSLLQGLLVEGYMWVWNGGRGGGRVTMTTLWKGHCDCPVEGPCGSTWLHTMFFKENIQVCSYPVTLILWLNLGKAPLETGMLVLKRQPTRTENPTATDANQASEN